MKLDLGRDLLFHLSPVSWAQNALGFTPDPWQAEVLSSNAKRIILNCHRQSGKSTVAAILALHAALFDYPAPLILLLSPSLRQSVELFRKVLDFYHSIAEQFPPPEALSSLRLELAHGARIIALPSRERTIRGFGRVALLIVDEAARVDEELYTAALPFLSVSDGRLILLSTPAGPSGFFYRIWTSDDPTWLKITARAEDCPRISPRFLEEMRRLLPGPLYAQEYECQFVSSLGTMFPPDLLARAVVKEAKRWEV